MPLNYMLEWEDHTNSIGDILMRYVKLGRARHRLVPPLSLSLHLQLETFRLGPEKLCCQVMKVLKDSGGFQNRSGPLKPSANLPTSRSILLTRQCQQRTRQLEGTKDSQDHMVSSQFCMSTPHTQCLGLCCL